MELKDLLAYTDIEASSLDEFKEKFQSKFAPKGEFPDLEKERSSITGRITGAMQTKAKTLFSLDPEEIKGKPWEEVLELAAKKKNEEIESLKELSLKTNDGALKELNEKIEKLNKSKDEYKTAAQLAQEALEKERNEFAGKFKSYKAESVFKDSYLKVQPKLASLSEAEQFYLNNLVKENVIIDFDEADQPIVLNKEGKRWNDPNKAGAFLSPDAVIEQIAAEKNFIKKNDAGERKPIFVSNQQAGSGQQQNTVKQVHPNALKAEG